MRLLISNFHPHKGGGHDVYLKTILSSTIREHFQIFISSPKSSRFGEFAKNFNTPFYPNNYQISSLSFFAIIISVFKAIKICLQIKPKIIHTNGGHDQFIFCLVNALLGTNIPIIRSHHTVKKYPDNVLNRFLYNNLTQLNIYQTIAQYKKTTTSLHSLEPRNSTTISHGVPLEKFRSPQIDPNFIKNFKIKETDFIFGSIAGIAPYKRVDIFLNAFKQAKIDHSLAKIVLAGDPAYIQPILEEVKKLDLSRNFIFTRFLEDVSKVLPIFDVGFIMSDQIESCSIATREMMAASIPIISSNFPGSEENITNEKDGIIVPATDINMTSIAIEYFFHLDKERLNKMKCEVLKKATKHFDQDKKMLELNKIYSKLLPEII